MLFHTFCSQEERRKFGGSYFIEFQYCRSGQGSDIKKIVSVDAIGHWKNDSLYIYGDDENTFMSHYKDILTDGVYNNGKSGIVDLYGINYYSEGQTALIKEKVKRERPLDHQVLLNWLGNMDQHTGFYVLGL